MKIKRMLMSFAVLGLGLFTLTSCGDAANEIEIVNEDGTTEKVTIEATKDKEKVAKALNAVSQKEAEKELTSAEISVKGNVDYAFTTTTRYPGLDGKETTDVSNTSVSAKANAVLKVELDKEELINSVASAKGSAEINMTLKQSSNSVTMKYKASGNAYLDAGYAYADYDFTSSVLGQNQIDSGKYKISYEKLGATIQEIIGQISSGDFPSVNIPEIGLPSDGEMTIEEVIDAYGITITGTSADSITFGFVLDEKALGQDIDGDETTNLDLVTMSLTFNTVYMVPSAMKVNAGDVLKYVEIPTSDNPLDLPSEVKVTKSNLSFEYSMKFSGKVDKLTDAQKAEYVEM